MDTTMTPQSNKFERSTVCSDLLCVASLVTVGHYWTGLVPTSKNFGVSNKPLKFQEAAGLDAVVVIFLVDIHIHTLDNVDCYAIRQRQRTLWLWYCLWWTDDDGLAFPLWSGQTTARICWYRLCRAIFYCGLLKVIQPVRTSGSPLTHHSLTTPTTPRNNFSYLLMAYCTTQTHRPLLQGFTY